MNKSIFLCWIPALLQQFSAYVVVASASTRDLSIEKINNKNGADCTIPFSNIYGKRLSIHKHFLWVHKPHDTPALSQHAAWLKL